MTLLSTHEASRVRNLALSALHHIAADTLCEVPDIIALITPSQPNPPPSAVQTDGAAESSSLPTEPSVDLSGLAAHEQGPTTSTDASQERAQTATGLGAGGDNPDPTSRPTATAKTDVPVDRGEASGGGQSQDNSGVRVASVEPPPRPITNRQRVRECHEAHPDWTAAQIADAIDLGTQQVRVIAHQIGVKPAKASPAKPQEAVEPPPAPKVRLESKQPPAVIPVARALPLPPPAVKPMQKGPQGRFYIREKTVIGKPSRWVHQSLAPCPTGPGPLMTLDRKWAWYDTMDRFKGAVKQWPELAEMRKEAVTNA